MLRFILLFAAAGTLACQEPDQAKTFAQALEEEQTEEITGDTEGDLRLHLDGQLQPQTADLGLQSWISSLEPAVLEAEDFRLESLGGIIVLH